MKLTWTFYPKGQASISLTVVYVPKLDALSVAGYLDVATNTAYVSWTNFRIFDTGEQSLKKSLFSALVRVDQLDQFNQALLPYSPGA
jgi:hypothetical protein